MKNFKLLMSLLLIMIFSVSQAQKNNEVDYGDHDETIVGGTEADFNEFPYQVSVRVDGDPFCGGTILNEEWILTANHCVNNGAGIITNANRIEIRAGVKDVNNSRGQDRTVAQVIVFPGYTNASLGGDVALLRLNTPLNFSTPAVGAIPYVNADLAGVFDAPGIMATISGWGTTSFGGTASDQLLHADVPIVTNALCQAQYGFPISNDQIGAGFAGGGIDACQGDSGGPMVVADGNGGRILAGVTSWGNQCALPNFSGMYARVSEFGDFIRDNTGIVPVGHVVGNEFLCSSGTYSLSFVTPNTTTSWNVTPAHYFTTSAGDGTAVTLNKANPFVSGEATITFSIDDNFGNTTTSSKTFWVGKPQVTVNPSGIPAIQAQIGSNITLQAEVLGASTSSLHWWKGQSSVNALNLVYSPQGYAVVECLQTGYYFIYVTANNQCGTSNYRQIPINVTTGGGGGGPQHMKSKPINLDIQTEYNIEEKFNFYPNPIEKNTFNVEVSQRTNGKLSIQLINAGSGKPIHLFEKQMEAGNHEFSFNDLDYLAKGLYLLRVITPERVISKKIFK